MTIRTPDAIEERLRGEGLKKIEYEWTIGPMRPDQPTCITYVQLEIKHDKSRQAYMASLSTEYRTSSVSGLTMVGYDVGIGATWVAYQIGVTRFAPTQMKAFAELCLKNLEEYVDRVEILPGKMRDQSAIDVG